MRSTDPSRKTGIGQIRDCSPTSVEIGQYERNLNWKTHRQVLMLYAHECARYCCLWIENIRNTIITMIIKLIAKYATDHPTRRFWQCTELTMHRITHDNASYVGIRHFDREPRKSTHFAIRPETKTHGRKCREYRVTVSAYPHVQQFSDRNPNVISKYVNGFLINKKLVITVPVLTGQTERTWDCHQYQ